MVVVDKANEAVGGKAKAKEEAKKDIDSYRPGFSLLFLTFIKILRTIFGLSVGEELYCFLVRFLIFSLFHDFRILSVFIF